MEFKPKHLWIAGFTIWLLAVASMKIWPRQQSFGHWQHHYNLNLMKVYSNQIIDSIDAKSDK